MPLGEGSWLYKGEPVNPDEVFEIREDEAALTLAIAGESEGVRFAVVDRRGEDVTDSVLTTSSGDASTVVIHRQAMRPGQVYTLNGTVAARNPETGDKALSLRVTSPINWLIPLLIVGGALLLAILLLVLLLARRRKKPAEEEEEEEENAAQPWEDTAEDELEKTRREANTGVPERKHVVRCLVYQEKAGDDADFETRRQVITDSATIGRDADCDIFYNGVSYAERTISHRHATLLLDSKGRLYIEPNPAAKNPTSVNGETITGATELLPGAQVQMGAITWKVTAIEMVHKN